ncbi:MAG: GTPase Era [Ruminococcus sp.]|nr:GTPase Era [Ruminococcus sp.]
MNKITEKSAFVTIMGLPNAGKSTLLNTLTGDRIAAVTPKPQTTRTRITGIVTKAETQYVFIDTPGVVVTAKNKLNERMNKAVREARSDADVIVFVVDMTRRTSEAEQGLIKRFGETENVILLLNKIDAVKEKGRIAERIEILSKIYQFQDIIPISAMTGDGIDLLWKTIDKFTKISPHFFPDDKITDRSEESLASEMIRERLMMNLDDEIPHGIAVGIEKFSERLSKSKSGEDILDIEAIIYCERESHKGIVIGKKGAMLRLVGEQARRSLENFFRIKVNLKLWVKVKEDWRNRDGIINNIITE